MYSWKHKRPILLVSLMMRSICTESEEELFETEIEKYPQWQGQGLERGDRKEGDRELYIHFLFVSLRVSYVVPADLYSLCTQR